MNNTNNNRLQELDTAPLGKLLWKYSLPAVVGIVVMSIYNIIDRIFIGQGVGPDAIAGLAITFPVMNVSVAFGVLIGAGASARTSILLGMQAKDKAEQVLGNSMVMTLVFGTFYIAMFAIFMDPVLRMFGASDTSLPYAHDFMLYILPGLMFNNITFSFNNVMRASGYPTKAMITMFIGAGLNVILAPIFIFWFKMGIKGAAIATDISMGVSMLFVLAHFFNKNNEIHFKSGIYRLRRDILMPILAIGAAPCIVNSAGCVINAVINNTVYHYGGDQAVAAIGIFTAVTGLVVTFVIGVCMGMQPIVGYNYGAKRFDRLMRTFWMSAGVCTIVCTIGCLVCQIFPEAISRMFTSDPSLIAASATTLRLATAAFWIAGFQMVVTNFFQSVGEAGKSIFMSLTRQVLFIIPFLLILPQFWKIDGVWLAFPFSDLCSTVTAALMMVWQIKKIRRLENRN
ncbi:MAG: MATE family efflux transporter [Muribaculaceae bacterium]|nr:MATE family efflux transporter [Muribaculaceae bacterium]